MAIAENPTVKQVATLVIRSVFEEGGLGEVLSLDDFRFTDEGWAAVFTGSTSGGEPEQLALTFADGMISYGTAPAEPPTLSELDPLDALEYLMAPVDFAAKKGGKKKGLKKKKCTKGKACGGSCIAKNRKCKTDPPSPASGAAARALTNTDPFAPENNPVPVQPVRSPEPVQQPEPPPQPVAEAPPPVRRPEPSQSTQQKARIEPDGLPSKDDFETAQLQSFEQGGRSRIYETTIDGQRYVVKTATGEGSSREIDAEVFASKIAQDAGVGSVPVREFEATVDGQKVRAMAMPFVDGDTVSTPAGARAFRDVSDAELTKAYLFDYVTGQGDRNNGGVIVNNGKASLIDNGYAFRAWDLKEDLAVDPIANEMKRRGLFDGPVPTDAATSLVNASRSNLANFPDTLDESGLSGRAKTSFQARIDALANAGSWGDIRDDLFD